MDTLRLQFTDPSDHDWQTFLATQKRANIFHHAAWSRLMQECYGYRPFVAVIRDAHGEICAGLPMMEVAGLFGHRRWISLPFSDHCAPLYYDSIALEELKRTLEVEIQKLAALKAEIRWALFAANPTPSFVLHTLCLEANADKVCRGIHHSHLRNMRLAQTNGVRIVHAVGKQELSSFYDLHLQTRHRQGVPIQPWKYFRLLEELVLERGLGFISLAWHDAVCLAGAIFLHWSDTLTYKYGASTDLGLSLRANHLLFWDAIRWGCAHGYSALDFGRTDCDNQGLRLFKARWGAVENPLYYSTIPAPSRPSLSDHRFKDVVQSVIKWSPRWVCRLSGELLYRYFG